MGFGNRFKVRNKTVRGYVRSVRENPRNAWYNLLPLISTVEQRKLIAGLITRFQRRPLLPHTEAGSRLVHELKNNGVTSPVAFLSRTEALEARRHFESILTADPWRPELGFFSWSKLPSDAIRMGYYDPVSTLTAPRVLGLFNDPLVVEVAERYLGCRPVLDNVFSWWSFPGDRGAVGTQRFHRDYDTVSGIKVFLYLSDVSETSGPHTYVRGSHIKNSLVRPDALSDQEVEGEFGKDKLVSVEGEMGTLFFADTFGIHKGGVPTTGARLVASAQFSSLISPHAPAEPPFLFSDPRFAGLKLDRTINKYYFKD